LAYATARADEAHICAFARCTREEERMIVGKVGLSFRNIAIFLTESEETIPIRGERRRGV